MFISYNHILLSSSLNDGLVETLNRLCASTVNTYSFKAKMADLNDALDWYFQIAYKSDGQWAFDDSSNALPPIDYQNLVNGTNRYKISAFADALLDLNKLEAIDSAGTGHILIPERLEALGFGVSGVNVLGNASGIIGSVMGASFKQLYTDAPPGLPVFYVKYGNFIYLRPNPNYDATSGLIAYYERPANKFLFVSVTMTIATPGVLTATAHGLSNGDTVILETDGALPTGFSVDTQYFVVSSATDTFELSATSGGTAINTTGSQSGNHSFLKTSATPGIPSTHHIMLVRKAALHYLSYTSSFKLGDLPQQNAKDEIEIATYFARRGKDIRPRLSVLYADNR